MDSISVMALLCARRGVLASGRLQRNRHVRMQSADQALPVDVAQFDGAAQRLHDLVTDGQPQARAAARIAGRERLEQPLGQIAVYARPAVAQAEHGLRSEEQTSELQSPCNLVCRLLLEKKKHKTRLCLFSSPCHIIIVEKMSTYLSNFTPAR